VYLLFNQQKTGSYGEGEVRNLEYFLTVKELEERMLKMPGDLRRNCRVFYAKELVAHTTMEFKEKSDVVQGTGNSGGSDAKTTAIRAGGSDCS